MVQPEKTGKKWILLQLNTDCSPRAAPALACSQGHIYTSKWLQMTGTGSWWRPPGTPASRNLLPSALQLLSGHFPLTPRAPHKPNAFFFFSCRTQGLWIQRVGKQGMADLLSHVPVGTCRGWIRNSAPNCPFP